MKAVICCLLLLLLSSSIPTASGAPRTAEAVVYCDLAENGSMFSGRQVRVRAIYRYAFEVQRLEAPECCSGRGDKIWVEIQPSLDRRSEKLFRRFPKGEGVVLATFVGRFESGGAYGTFADSKRLLVERIESVEKTASSARRQASPPWAARHCGEDVDSRQRLDSKNTLHTKN